ncbi:MAG: DNA polymerase III subunit delta [Bacteroidia bacterium]|nr:DNA polymerase III subunit delta [Bacteroidia bacterium]
MSDFNSIAADLKARKFKPVYFLTGEETYYIDLLAEQFEKKVLEESEREFNLTVLYGNEADIPRILSEAKRFPMMGDYTVVIVKEAQHIRALSRSEKLEEDNGAGEEEKKKGGGAVALLQTYVEHPQLQTILVFCYKYKKLDKRTSLYKSLQKHGVLFEAGKMYDDKLPGWITDYFKKAGYGTDPKAAVLMAEYLGNDLAKIANEAGKLMINIPPGSTISPDHIQHFIGISKEYNSFELNGALSKKDVLRANRIVNHFSANPKDNPLIMVISTLFGHFNKVLTYHHLPDKSKAAAELKVNPFFVREYEAAARNYSLRKTEEIMGYLREYDLRSKGYLTGQAGEGELLKELVFKILH